MLRTLAQRQWSMGKLVIVDSKKYYGGGFETVKEKVRLYKRICNGMASVEKYMIGLVLMADIVISVANVISRYLAHQSWSFVEEVVVASFVLMSMVGAALCARRTGDLVNMTFIVDKLSKKARLIIEVITTLILAVFSFLIVYYGIQRCMDQAAANRITASLRIPEWWYSMFVPVGGFCMIVHSLERVTDCVFEIIDCKNEGHKTDVCKTEGGAEK